MPSIHLLRYQPGWRFPQAPPGNMNNKSTTRWAGVLPLWLGVLCSQAMNVSAFCPNQQLPGAVHSSLLAFAPPAHHHRIHAQKQIRGIEAVDQLPWTRRQAGSSRGGARLTMDFSIASLFSSFRKQAIENIDSSFVICFKVASSFVPSYKAVTC